VPLIDTQLARYYSTLDEGRIADAVSLLHEHVRYAMFLPGGVGRGSSRKDMQVYLESRPPVRRKHVLLRVSRDGDAESVYGAVTDDGNVTGHFAAVAHVDADGLIDAYQVTFDPELVLIPSTEEGVASTPTPVLETWFGFMDSDRPERVLDMITPDFQMSIQFSTGAGQASEFLGDRAGLVSYLEQREVSVLVHHLTHGSRVDDVEIALGKTTRDGTFEAAFNVSAELEPGTEKVRRLLIARTPEIEFS
jgi:hypothetical protein